MAASPTSGGCSFPRMECFSAAVQHRHMFLSPPEQEKMADAGVNMSASPTSTHAGVLKGGVMDVGGMDDEAL